MNLFTSSDEQQLAAQGLTLQEAKRQLELLRRGVEPIRLNRPATVGDGILLFSEQEKNELLALYESGSARFDTVKFVPASGAATRMFQDLFLFLDTGELNPRAAQFLKEWESLPFADRLRERIGTDTSPSALFRALLDASGLDYARMPKGLLPFHYWEGKSVTPLVSHIYEAQAYAAQRDGTTALHFTFSPSHLEPARQQAAQCADEIEAKCHRKTRLQFSTQAADTDTLAIDAEGNPFRKADGTLLFRPGGHGSLLRNLQQTSADIVFVRNIDNVLPPHRQAETIFYKKVLGGLLLHVIDELYPLMDRLRHGDMGSVTQARNFLQRYFPHQLLPDELSTDALYALLYRPFRICGMVKNEGQPGGGPFWVEDENGGFSLQIVEASQVSQEPGQQAYLRRSTHFNPVDMVLMLRDHRGKAFELSRYSDPNTAFISEKNHEGRALKALEHPGLWNGAMARWHTLFVEIPITVFNPVKTVNDLFNPAHLG